MKRSSLRVSHIAAVALALACGDSQRKPPPPEVAARLDEGIVARVGSEPIFARNVARIAQAQQVEPRVALDRAIFDALCAQEAQARKLDERTQRTISGVLARALLDDVAQQTRDEGPPTDKEIEDVTMQRWYDVARPDAVAVVHLVVTVPAESPPEVWARARELAKTLRQTVMPASELAATTPAPDYLPRRGIPMPTDAAANKFLELAKTVSAPPDSGLQIIAESLWPLGKDGATIRVERREVFDPLFVKAALALEKRGSLSEPFDSQFGVHVALKLADVPGAMLTLEERRARFYPEVMTLRSRRIIEPLLASLSEQATIDIERSVDALLGQVQVRK